MKIPDNPRNDIIANQETDRLNLILDASNIGTWEWDLISNELIWDEKNHEIFGAKPGEKVSHVAEFNHYVHEEDQAWVTKKLAEIIHLRENVLLEFRIRRPIDNEIRWISARGKVYCDSNSNPIKMIGVNFDISEKIKTQNKLEETHNQLDLVLRAAEIGTWYWDLASNDVVWDEQTHKVFGVDLGKFGGSFAAFAAYVHPEDLEHVNSQVNNTLKNDAPYFLNFRVIKPNGELIYLNARGTLYRNSFGKPCKIIGIVWDITKEKLAQAEILRTNRFKKAILDSTDYMIISTTDNGVITSFNKAAERLLEYSAEEMIGKQTPAIIHDLNEVVEYTKELNEKYNFNLEPGFETFVAKSKYLGETDSREWTYISKSGKRFPVLLSATSLQDDQNQIIGYLGIVKDISLDKQKNEELKFQQRIFKSFIKSTPLAVAMFDVNMNYLVYSDFWIKNYSLNETNLVGKNHYEVFPEIKKSYPQWLELHQRCLKGETIKCEGEKFIRADGNEEWIRYELHPWLDLDGKIAGLIMFTEVITEQVKSEKELQHKTVELERSNIDLEYFAYITSHDLKEPLRVIASYSKLLEKKLAKFNVKDESISSYVEYITSSIDRMQDMINDILAYSRVGRKTVYEEVSIDSILKNTLIDLSTIIIDKDAKISFDILPTMTICESEIRQLFQNLISNALKFINPERIPMIKISSKMLDENVWQFSVSDNGIGIEAEFFERIFIIFQRLHTREEFEGTGIGLALCKKIIENHNGKIWLESKLGEGTTFFFTISNMNANNKQPIEISNLLG
jgi:PAS domain S-box-containing protein